MRRISPDLWETQPDSPYPGVHTHAYLWTGAPNGNILFYSTVTDADCDSIAELGGIAHHYLSHRDEAGPMLATIAARFGARLHAPAAELFEIGQHAHVDVPLGSRHVDSNGVEVVPTPGHSPGSTCYLVPGTDGRRYLFTGDTIIHTATDGWAAGFIAGISEASALAKSLRLVAALAPDVVMSSAYAGGEAVHAVAAADWPGCVEHALAGLSTTV